MTQRNGYRATKSRVLARRRDSEQAQANAKVQRAARRKLRDTIAAEIARRERHADGANPPLPLTAADIRASTAARISSVRRKPRGSLASRGERDAVRSRHVSDKPTERRAVRSTGELTADQLTGLRLQQAHHRGSRRPQGYRKARTIRVYGRRRDGGQRTAAQREADRLYDLTAHKAGLPVHRDTAVRLPATAPQGQRYRRVSRPADRPAAQRPADGRDTRGGSYSTTDRPRLGGYVG